MIMVVGKMLRYGCCPHFPSPPPPHEARPSTCEGSSEVQEVLPSVEEFSMFHLGFY